MLQAHAECMVGMINSGLTHSYGQINRPESGLVWTTLRVSAELESCYLVCHTKLQWAIATGYEIAL